MNRRRAADIGFGLILLSYCVYAAFFIYGTSCEVEGETYFHLLDDAMISMRYAKNLAEGNGLVWNPGEEPVEGFTNLFWTLYMSLAHLAPLPPSKISLVIQVSALILLCVNLVFVRKIARKLTEGSMAAEWTAVALTAFYLPMNTWSLQGMEVGPLAAILSASVWMNLQDMERKTVSIRPYALLGLGMLIRIDMGVAFLAILLFNAFPGKSSAGTSDPVARKQHLIYGMGVFALAMGSQTAFRLWYYGDLLPNTYYLKMTGYPWIARILHGAYVYGQFIQRMNWALYLSPLLLLLIRRDRPILLLFWLFAAQSAYSIYVGGDAWEWWGGANRYVCVAMPLFFILLAAFLDHLLRVGLREIRSTAGRRIGAAAFAVTVLLCSISVNDFRDFQSLREWRLQDPPLHSIQGEGQINLAKMVLQVTSPEALVSVLWAGGIPYFANRRYVDMLGKSDRYLAHIPMRDTTGNFGYKEFYPGHMKWDYDYVLGQRKPDLVVSLWIYAGGAVPYLGDYESFSCFGTTVFARRDSENIRWDEVEEIRKAHRN